MKTKGASADAGFPRAQVSIEDITPRQAAKELYPANSAAARGISPAFIRRLRQLYVGGVETRWAAGGYWDEADRWVRPQATFASTWNDRERQAYGWGWEDAECGRFAR